ncbi:MAG: efflux RND transporter periplasmic adaptor subunit, partial [Saprospiraceae bacterium]|nr:efflux RND transporter periplasmic adaptor subunit [Saprospiraceae bacterium]
LRTGQSVTFSIVGFEEPFKAVIYAMATEISPTTRSFKVLAKCSNPKGQLRPGNFAKVDVTTGVNENAILIPTDAVIPVIDGQQVFVVRDGKVATRKVITGDRQGTMIEIKEGVESGDTVIISGLLNLSESVPVQVSNVVDFDPLIH